MNPSLKFFLFLIISLEISFIPNLVINLTFLVGSLLYLFISKYSLKKLALIIVFAFPAAFAIFSSLYWFSDEPNLIAAWTLFTRMYVLILLGVILINTTPPLTLARSLEQNFHLPTKLVYGWLAAFNFIPQMQVELKKIKVAALMRGQNLSWWSPSLYFKAILPALAHSEELSEGMLAHSFGRYSKRSKIKTIPLTWKDWLIFIFFLFFIQIFFIFCTKFYL
ncbi:energy-coupling factor transporter transmembrane component T family protein [Lactobacillus sp. PV012]|uniref:energy-coupling factor transporter transmembrane component T family protein n=1 Tax=Lactobacillus sp. PV012 TaxID=2594494 RepID=UPI0022407117|nr:energy-coupling factor transporter transmembrane component T [Lactobacillus sp. PV012]QNQ81681.1 energy-coupling factor transporter transmembrane protein EcfT [Lactobacillus sp. PV012]